MTDQTGPVDRTSYITSLWHLVADQLTLKNLSSAQEQSSRVEAKLPPVLLFSPHPDDESITGLLPLRLREEEGRRVINIALTLGSNPARREARAGELAEACRILGFAPQHFTPCCSTPERLKSFGKAESPEAAELVAAVLVILARHRPALVVYPHPRDGHPAHEGAARLLEYALRQFSRQGNTVAAVETECWQPLPRANLAVEGTVKQVDRLCTAISCHVGEVKRNPYHVRQPIRMLENGFRISEAAVGFGGHALPVAFCELYTLFRYRNGRKRRSRRLHFCPRSAGFCLDRLLTEAF